jgi:hypothetical protein
MKWNECERKRSWPDLMFCPSICLEELNRSTQILNRNIRLHEKKERLLTTQIRCLSYAHYPIRAYFFIKCSNWAFFLIHLVGGSPVGSTRHGGHWLAYCSLPRMIMMMENLLEWRLAKETAVLGQNLPQRHFVHQNSHLTRPGIEPGLPQWEASD